MKTNTTQIRAWLSSYNGRKALKSAILDVAKRSYTLAPICNKNGVEWLTVRLVKADNSSKQKLAIVDRRGYDVSHIVKHILIG